MSVSPVVRKCSRCSNVLPLTSEYFYRKTSEVGGFRYSCKVCDKKSDTVSNAVYYANNRAKISTRVHNRRRAIADFIIAHKRRSKCECGASDPAVLDFHHRDPSIKLLCIGSILKRGWSIDRILQEIAKCDVLCANCHRKKHSSTINQTTLSQHIRQYKVAHPCKCGESHPAALDFHHRDPTTKLFNIGSSKRSIAKTDIEISKCDIMCANCHRRKHR